jgi:hypothetical protein
MSKFDVLSYGVWNEEKCFFDNDAIEKLCTINVTPQQICNNDFIVNTLVKLGYLPFNATMNNFNITVSSGFIIHINDKKDNSFLYMIGKSKKE